MFTKLIMFLLVAGLLSASSAWAKNVNVTVGGQSDGGYGYGSSPILSFSPAHVTIDAGDTVTFVNAGGSHNIVSDTGLFRCAAGCDGDGKGGNGNPSDGWTVTVPFATAGTFNFHCEVHQSMGMSGTVTVNAVAPAFSIQRATTGLWFNNTQSGQGFDIQVLDSTNIAAVWYVFDNSGNPLWLIAVGTYSGNTATLNVTSTTGGNFPPNFDQTKIVRTAWGTFNLTFTDCNNGTASWTPTVPNFTSGSIPITRLTGISGLTCQ